MNNILRDRTKKFREPQRVEELGFYPFFRPIESEQSNEVIINGENVLMFGSNSYLGLTNHPKIKEASIAAVKKYGTGNAGSPFLNGTLDLHVELEHRLATYLKKEAALLYSTGFLVNVGVIPAITSKDDVIIMDEFNHASIIEGSRLSYAKTLKYRHNDMEALEKKLKASDGAKMKLIVVDGIFSMEGDIVNLPDIVTLAEKYDATIMTDCAHAIGVIGKQGCGTPNHFGLDDKVDLIGGTFSKSLASVGGFIAADHDTINFLKHRSRSMIFSASLPASNVASVLAALDLIEKEDEHIQRLWENTHYALKLCKEMNFEIGRSETPIIPIYVRDYEKTFILTTKLLEKGIFVNPVVPPAVLPEDTMLRFSIMATHTKEQIQYALEMIKKVGEELMVDTFHSV